MRPLFEEPPMRYFPSVVVTATLLASLSFAQETTKGPDGWQPASPREEIKPEFSFDPKGGPKGDGSFTIRADKRDGLHGWWQKTVPIHGGKFYQFRAVRKVRDVEAPRHRAIARI